MDRHHHDVTRACGAPHPGRERVGAGCRQVRRRRPRRRGPRWPPTRRHAAGLASRPRDDHPAGPDRDGGRATGLPDVPAGAGVGQPGVVERGRVSTRPLCPKSRTWLLASDADVGPGTARQLDVVRMHPVVHRLARRELVGRRDAGLQVDDPDVRRASSRTVNTSPHGQVDRHGPGIGPLTASASATYPRASRTSRSRSAGSPGTGGSGRSHVLSSRRRRGTSSARPFALRTSQV